MGRTRWPLAMKRSKSRGWWPMPKTFLVATFSDTEELLQAVHAVREADFRIYDVFAPYPIHGLDQAMGIRRTRLPWVTLVAGSCALLFAVLFQFYTTVLDWPLNVGGKPDNSTLAFIPISFELTVLLGGLSTVAALFFRARLYPGKKASLGARSLSSLPDAARTPSSVPLNTCPTWRAIRPTRRSPPTP